MLDEITCTAQARLSLLSDLPSRLFPLLDECCDAGKDWEQVLEPKLDQIYDEFAGIGPAEEVLERHLRGVVLAILSQNISPAEFQTRWQCFPSAHAFAVFAYEDVLSAMYEIGEIFDSANGRFELDCAYDSLEFRCGEVLSSIPQVRSRLQIESCAVQLQNDATRNGRNGKTVENSERVTDEGLSDWESFRKHINAKTIRANLRSF